MVRIFGCDPRPPPEKKKKVQPRLKAQGRGLIWRQLSKTKIDFASAGQKQRNTGTSRFCIRWAAAKTKVDFASAGPGQKTKLDVAFIGREQKTEGRFCIHREGTKSKEYFLSAGREQKVKVDVASAGLG